jgi:4-diphosphocytidyl-2-C-methyl-D-erythritol kinase
MNAGIRVPSFAKVNLGIEVVRRRSDGFHEIRTLFHSVSLCDEMEFEVAVGGGIHLEGNHPAIPWDESNLIVRAARLLQRESGSHKGAFIKVDKRIPPGKGLGGGSSNAAVTLWALDRIWDMNLGAGRLKDLGGLLGADVPYFLEGGLALGLGRGDICFPLRDLPPLSLLILFPDVAVPTSSIYGNHRISLTLKPEDSKIIRFLDVRDHRSLRNELEDTIFRLYPQLKEYKSLIQSPESELSLVSGSGSAVFSLFSSREEAEAAALRLGREYNKVVVDTISKTGYWQGLNQYWGVAKR